MTLNLALPAPGKQRNDGVSPPGCRKPPGLPAYFIHERVPQELHVDPGLSIDVHLKGKNHDHLVDKPRQRLDPAPAPRPHLRADIVKDRNARFAGGPRHSEVEVWKIDENDEVRPFAADRFGDILQRPPDYPQVADYLEEAHDGNIFGPGEDRKPRLPHGNAADAEKRRPGGNTGHLPDQLAAVEIAGRLPRHDKDPFLCRPVVRSVARMPIAHWVRIPFSLSRVIDSSSRSRISIATSSARLPSRPVTEGVPLVRTASTKDRISSPR